jgi:hypothetical protein
MISQVAVSLRITFVVKRATTVQKSAPIRWLGDTQLSKGARISDCGTSTFSLAR